MLSFHTYMYMYVSAEGSPPCTVCHIHTRPVGIGFQVPAILNTVFITI